MIKRGYEKRDKITQTAQTNQKPRESSPGDEAGIEKSVSGQGTGGIPTLTPPSDFLFNRLLAAVETKRQVMSRHHILSSTWQPDLRETAALTRGQEPPQLLKRGRCSSSSAGRKGISRVSEPWHSRTFFAMDEGSVEADTLCLGRETTFGTRASRGTGSTVFNSFYPGLQTVPM